MTTDSGRDSGGTPADDAPPDSAPPDDGLPGGAPPDGPPDGPPGSRPEPASRSRRAANWLREHSRHVMVVAVVSAVLGAAVTPVVDEVVSRMADDAPPGCPGAGCDGRNPMDEGCTADVVTWQPAKANPVALRVRYSKHCGAVWGQLLAGERGDTVTVRAGDSQQTGLVSYGSDQFTPMAAVGETFRARVCAEPTQIASRTGNWQRYCIEATQRTHWKP